MATWQLRFWVIPSGAIAPTEMAAGLSESLRSGTVFPWRAIHPNLAGSNATLLELMPGQSWDSTATLWGSEDSDYLMEVRDDRELREVVLGIDARHFSPLVAEAVAHFLHKIDAVLVECEGRALVTSDASSVIASVKSSPAWQFVTAPQSFLESLRKH